MEIFLPILVVLVLVCLVLAWVFGGSTWGWFNAEKRHRGRIMDEVESLRFRVPEGADPAVIIATLRKNGFDATSDIGRAGHQDVVIACPQGKERARPQVRSILAGESGINFEGDQSGPPPIEFVDEQHG